MKHELGIVSLRRCHHHLLEEAPMLRKLMLEFVDETDSEESVRHVDV